MKTAKRILALVLALVLCLGLAPLLPQAEAASIAVNSANFPDANFRSYVASNFDTNHDGYLSDAERAAVTSIDVSNRNIANMKGIEYFSAVTYLSCSGNSFTELDLLNTNPSIESLYCYNNTKLTSLEVSGHDALTVLDVSGCTALTDLGCVNCDLISLNVKNCTDLQYLECDSSRLTNLDVQTCPALMVLSVYNNKLTSLNLCQNPELWFLNCEHNQLKTLDVSGNPELQLLYCTDNQLTSLDFSGNKDLTTLCCGDNRLTTLAISGHSSLEYLDVSNNASLKKLSCVLCCLTTLHVTGCTALEDLRCAYNQLTALDVSQNTALKNLDCTKNNLTSLDISKNTALQFLDCQKNLLTSLDVSKNTALQFLNCSINRLISLDVSKNTALRTLKCYGNRLASLDVSKNTALMFFECYGNLLTSLDISKNTELSTLYCFNNGIDTLNIGSCPKLIQAYKGNKSEATDSESGTVYWLYSCSSPAGQLGVDKTTEIIAPADLGSFTFDFRSGPVEHPGFAIGLELVVMSNQGDIGMSSGGYNVSLLDLDLDGHSDVRIYSKNGTFYFYVDARTNLRGTYTLTVSEAVKNAFVSSDLDYYSSFTFQYPSPWNPFTDVKEGKDYYDAILWAYYHDPQVTAGVTATTFGVGKAVKRGDAMFYLWVAAGKPEPTLTKSPFTDVTDPKAYYYKAILWAYENGITSGVSATEFGRKKTVSRRDMLVFLYKQQGSPVPTLTQSPYSDVTDPKAYYFKAVMWAYEKGIERGSGGKFNGKTNCLRETVVLWMYRVLAG